MGWTIKVNCDRCNMQADCETRKTCPEGWEEFEKMSKKSYKFDYWTFCPHCAEEYRKTLAEIADAEEESIAYFFRERPL